MPYNPGGGSLTILEDTIAKRAKEWVEGFQLIAVTRHGNQWVQLPDRMEPSVLVGDFPSNLTGAIDHKRIPSAPVVIIQAAGGEDDPKVGKVACHLGVVTYDNSENKQGHRDTINVIGALRFGIWRERILDHKFQLCEPWLNWQRVIQPDEMPGLWLGLVTVHYNINTPTPKSLEGEGEYTGLGRPPSGVVGQPGVIIS